MERNGLLVQSCIDIEQSINLFFIEKHHHFVWPTFEIGSEVTLSDIDVPEVHKPVTLTSISQHPKIFLIKNLISNKESDVLVEYMLSKSIHDGGLERSLVSSDGQESNARTSYTGWDDESLISIELKARAIQLLRLYNAEETWIESIQIVRYFPHQYYSNHYDFFEPSVQNDIFSKETLSKVNRFATIIFYLSDVESGGETIFPLANQWWNEKTHFVESHQTNIDRSNLPNISTICEDDYSLNSNKYLRFKPQKLSSILFYSQTSNFNLDYLSLHGSCPVLSKDNKWIATIWVWNGSRDSSYNKNTELIQQKTFNSRYQSILSQSQSTQQTSIVAMFKLSNELQHLSASIRLRSPENKIVEFFRENKPIVVNSFVGEVWTVELILDTSISGDDIEDNIIILKKEVIQSIANKGKLQQYLVSINN